MTSFSRLPNLKGDIPGPKAKTWLERDEKVISTSYTRAYPLVAEEGRGAVVRDVDGNDYLDFAAGIAVVATGHCHPEVVAAIREQAGKLIHLSGTDFYYTPQIALAERLGKAAPGDKPKRVFFSNSGAEAVESAMKLAKHHTGRKRFIAFYGAFHGRTHGALSLTASKAIQKEKFFPLVDGVTHIPYANCLRCPFGQKAGDCAMECLAHLEDEVFAHLVPPKEVAAIFVEPVQGEGGYIVPPKEFLQGLRRICDKHGILLVADEVQAGMGRTGKLFASEHFDLIPDIITLAKGIASGLPLGVTIAPADIMNWPPGSHASTFGGNPVACAASMATLDLLEREYLENSRIQGEFLRHSLRELMGTHPQMGDVRGLGLMVAVELVENRDSMNPNPALRDALVDECFRQGLLILGCGANSVRFCPPLVVDREQTAYAVKVFEKAIVEAQRHLGAKSNPF